MINRVQAATRADVARRAGVAPSTVSYALNGGRTISDSTRQRIRAAMVDLGYSPNPLAASLAGGRSRLLALLFPSLERGVSESDLEYLVAAADAARGYGYRVVLWTTDAHDLGSVEQLCQSSLTDGLLLMEVLLDDRRVDVLQRAGIPFSLIGRTAEAAGMPHADRDFEHDARACLAHLLRLGHAHVALIAPPRDLYERGFGAVVRPVDALTAAARSAGLDLTVMPCAASVDAGRAALQTLRAGRPDITAVISLVDEATMGLFHEATAEGVRIPDDLSAISLSASPQRCAWFSPGLTAVSPPADDIGRGAALALVDLLEGRPVDTARTLWAGELVDRGSTAPVRSR